MHKNYNALRLFKALRLFFLTNFPCPTVIPCPTSIPDSRVIPKIVSGPIVKCIIKKSLPRANKITRRVKPCQKVENVMTAVSEFWNSSMYVILCDTYLYIFRLHQLGNLYHSETCCFDNFYLGIFSYPITSPGPQIYPKISWVINGWWHRLWVCCLLGCANKDLWVLCAPIFIIVVYCRTATSYFLGGKE